MPSSPRRAAPAADAADATAGAQTLRRGLLVLRLFARVGPGGLRMSDIVRRIDLNKATVVRLTRTLVDEGFVLHDAGSGRYRLGPEAYAVGLAAQPSYELQHRAAPTLRQLALEAGDTVYFNVLHGFESICLSHDEGDFPIRNQVMKAGDRFPLGVGAGSVAMLAALDDAEVDASLAHSAELRARRYPRCTDAAIRRLVRETREQGYCFLKGLVVDGSCGLGVAVFDAQGGPVASISIAAIELRFEGVRRLALAQRLVQASADLTALQANADGDGD